MFRLLALLFVLYICYSQYLLNGYDRMNSKLLTINDTLLHSCTKSTISNPEKERYN